MATGVQRGTLPGNKGRGSPQCSSQHSFLLQHRTRPQGLTPSPSRASWGLDSIQVRGGTPTLVRFAGRSAVGMCVCAHVCSVMSNSATPWPVCGNAITAGAPSESPAPATPKLRAALQGPQGHGEEGLGVGSSGLGSKPPAIFLGGAARGSG